MALTMIYDIGDTVYYPKLHIKSDKPMEVVDRYIGRGANGLFVQYLTDQLLDRLAEEMHENREDHYDNVVVITGREGTGKSNLAYWVAKKYDPDFRIEDGYVYDMMPFLEKINRHEVPRGKVFWFDEATNVLSARNWMTDTNKSLDQLLEMLRSYEMTLIMCIPLLDRLDLYVRQSRMRYLLQTHERYWEKRDHASRGYFELKRWPNFRSVCWGTFPEMPESEKRIYENLKVRSQKSKVREIYERFDDQNQPRIAKSAKYNRVMAAALRDLGLTYDEISDRTGIPSGTLKSWISEGRKEGNDGKDSV